MATLVDSAELRVLVRNRVGEIIAREVRTRIVSTPDFPGLDAAELDRGMLRARGPGTVTLHAWSDGVTATPIVLRVAPRFAVLGAFEQPAPARGGETIIARGYRLDLAGELTIAGSRVVTELIDTATMRVVLPAIDTAACRGGAHAPAALAAGVVSSPGVRLRRPGELALAPGELVRLGVSGSGCVRLAPIAGAEYALMYADTRPIVAAEQGSFPHYSGERFEFSVAFNPWTGGPASSAPVSQAPPIARIEVPVDVVPAPTTASAPPDAVELRATPWQVGDRASFALWGGGYESGTIVRVSDPFVAMVLDREFVPEIRLKQFDEAMRAIQREGVPTLRTALSSTTPVTSAGSGQFVIVLSSAAALGNAGVSFGYAVAVAPSVLSHAAVEFITHELAHAWQSQFLRDQCTGAPPPCAYWSTWATEGGADFLAQEVQRRLSNQPLVGSTGTYGTQSTGFSVCCDPVYSPMFGAGYGSAQWFLRDLLVRTVVAGADYDRSLAAVTRGALESWHELAPGTGLKGRLTALLGTPWNPLDGFEASVWGLGMDESPSPVHQYLPRVHYHLGRVGSIESTGYAIAGPIAGHTFGHVQLIDARGVGGAYRYSVGRDFVWAVGRVR